MALARLPSRIRRPITNGLAGFVLIWMLIAFRRDPEWVAAPHFSDAFAASAGAPRMPTTPILPPLETRVPCYGPRDQIVDHNPDDALHSVVLAGVEYPAPFLGSHEAVGLEKTWMTVDGRYGPYGYGEKNKTYARTRVNWDKIDWGNLQNKCFQDNAHRFGGNAVHFENAMRMQLLNRSTVPAVRNWADFNNTRRTAIVVRAWEGFEYKQEDMLYLRSLIVETSLRNGGEYQVILLVHIKDRNRNIFSSKDAYDKALTESGVPKELRSITVLWDELLLESWYDLVREHETMWQVFQPMQLFALHYPEFDHYWQLELDMRFTGDAGKFLSALETFARNEPRKQAIERASFQHIPSLIGNYSEFFTAVDTANKHSAHYWGPTRNPEISSIGPAPPFRRAVDDKTFSWGVGEEADAIVTSFCANATASRVWTFRDWIPGFSAAGAAAPRFFCPPAIQRASRTLLLAMHEAQHLRGLCVPSEATLPSWALWLGLKLSFPQHPVYWKIKDDERAARGWWKGGPRDSPDGLGPSDPGHPGGKGLTFWWESDWPRKMMDAWMIGYPWPQAADFPWVLREVKEEVYIPNMMLHPVKHR